MTKDELYEYLKRTPENSNVNVVKAIAMREGGGSDPELEKKVDEILERLNDFMDSGETIEEGMAELVAELNEWFEQTIPNTYAKKDEVISSERLDNFNNNNKSIEEWSESVEEILDNEVTAIENLSDDYSEFKQGVSEGMTVIAESLDNHARDISALQEAVSKDIPAIYATKSEVDTAFLKIDDSYDLEIAEWFHGETGQKTQVGDTAEYRYTFTPNFKLPRNVFVRNLNFTDWDDVVQIKNDGPRIFVLEYKDSEDNLHEMTFVPTGDQWFASLNFDEKPELAPETLELNIVALVNPGQEAGEYATINVKDKFYGAVHYALVQELAYLLENAEDSQEALQAIVDRLETLNTKIGQALMKSESYTATRRLLFTSHAARIGDNRYKLWIYDGEPLAEDTCVGSTNADGSLRSLILYREGKIEDLELWYKNEYHTVTLVHMSDGEGNEWFEFETNLAIQDQDETLSIRDVIAIEVEVTDEFYAAVASLIGESLINMDTRISNLDNNLSGVYTRLGGVENRLNNFLDSGESIEDEFQGMADQIEDRLNNLQLVRNYYKVTADGINHEFIIARSDVIDGTIQNIYINGVRDFDSTVVVKSALGATVTSVHMRENESGTLVPLILDTGDKIVIETLGVQ